MPGFTAPVRWLRHPRARRISVRIDAREAAVVVTLPMRSTRADGLALLERNAAWVRGRLSALPDVPGFADGGQVALAGVQHRICHVPDARGVAWVEHGRLMVAGRPECLARRVSEFLRAEARLQLTAQAREKAAQAEVTVGRVSVRDTRSRWGSCSPKGSLMFCWRLLMAPPLVQDYVVAHEVAHLRHLDHGPDFWALAARLSPHRAAAEAWLDREGPLLQRVA